MRSDKSAWSMLGALLSLSALAAPFAFSDPPTLERQYLGATIEPTRRMRASGFEWDHEIHVAVPKGYYSPENASRRYPVLWVTDASYAFDLAITTVNGNQKIHMPDLIIVGIGEEDSHFLFQRIYDFFPSRPREVSLPGRVADLERDRWAQYEMSFAEKGTPLRYGGARDFLAFLVDSLRPALAHDYRMMPEENTLFGYSAGGAFCEYVLLTRPAAFNKYICGGGYTADVLDAEAQYARGHKDLKARVFFGIADEDVLASGFPIASALQSRGYPSLELQTEVFAHQDHAQAIPLTMSQGLVFIWETSKLPFGKL